MPKETKQIYENPDKVDKGIKTWTVDKENKDIWDFYSSRKVELQDSRKNIKGLDLDALFSKVEQNYRPHIVQVKAPRTINNSQPNLYIKVSIALNTVINTNFDADFIANKDEYQKNSEVLHKIYLHTIDPAVTSSRQTYINAAFNTMMFGSGGLRSFRRFREREVFGEDNKTKTKIVDIDEPDCEALHPLDYWVNETATPGDRWTFTEYLRRKVYSWREFKKMFPESRYPGVEAVMPGGDVSQHYNVNEKNSSNTNDGTDTKKVEVYFYENELEDLLIIEAAGVGFYIGPLPQQNKRLSLSHTFWTLRSTDSINGIGIWEIIEQDQQLIDMVRDMSIDQLKLAIFSIIFHSGANKLDEKKLKIEAGKMFKMLDPEKIKQFQLNSPDDNVQKFIQMFQKDLDEASGISKVLSGEQLGKTAFEANLNQEAGLRRLKTPANNLKELFEWEATNRIGLIKQIYSIPRIKPMVSKEEIEAFTEKMKAENNGKVDPDVFFVDENDKMFEKEYRTLPLNIKEDDKGNFVESSTPEFIKVKPGLLQWEGKIRIKLKSLLVSSEELDRQSKLRLANLLTPLFQVVLGNPSAAALYLPMMKQIITTNEQKPEDWLPKQFFNTFKEEELKAKQKEEELEQMTKGNAQKDAEGKPVAGAPPLVGTPGNGGVPPKDSGLAGTPPGPGGNTVPGIPPIPAPGAQQFSENKTF